MPPKPIPGVPITRLPGVISATDLGPWQTFTAVGNSGGMQGRPYPADRIYGLVSPGGERRFVCGACGLAFTSIGSCTKHRSEHNPPKGRAAHVKRDTELVKAAPIAVEAAPAGDRQMTIDEVGLDLAGPAIIEGISALVASRQNARSRVQELEAENAALRATLARIRALAEG